MSAGLRVCFDGVVVGGGGGGWGSSRHRYIFCCDQSHAP